MELFSINKVSLVGLIPPGSNGDIPYLTSLADIFQTGPMGRTSYSLPLYYHVMFLS